MSKYLRWIQRFMFGFGIVLLIQFGLQSDTFVRFLMIFMIFYGAWGFENED